MPEPPSKPPTALVLSTTFYPHGVVGSVRVTNWARALPDLGWRCVNAARSYGQLATPANLARGVHPSARLWYLDGPKSGAPIDADPHASDDAPTPRAPAASGGGGGRKSAKAMVADTIGPFVAPDAQRLVWMRLWPAIKRVIEAERPDVMITSGPQNSIHLMGMRARAMGVPWVADFRDPSLLDHRMRPSGLASIATPWHVAFDRAIYRKASAVTHAIPLHARWARRAYRVPEDRCVTLTHPCPSDLSEGRIEPSRAPEGVRSVRIVGVIGRDEALGLARAVADVGGGDGGDVELRIVGPTGVDESAMREALGDRFVPVGAVPHDEAKRQIAGADVLVSYLTPSRAAHIGVSSKLYEFAAARRPIITINPTRPDLRLLRQLPAVSVLRDPDQPAIARALREALRPEAREAMESGEAAQAFRERHGWAAHGERLRAVLERSGDRRA